MNLPLYRKRSDAAACAVYLSAPDLTGDRARLALPKPGRLQRLAILSFMLLLSPILPTTGHTQADQTDSAQASASDPQAARSWLIAADLGATFQDTASGESRVALIHGMTVGYFYNPWSSLLLSVDGYNGGASQGTVILLHTGVSLRTRYDQSVGFLVVAKPGLYLTTGSTPSALLFSPGAGIEFYLSSQWIASLHLEYDIIADDNIPNILRLSSSIGWRF